MTSKHPSAQQPSRPSGLDLVGRAVPRGSLPKSVRRWQRSGAWCLVLGAFLVGCSSPTKPAPAPASSAAVDQLNLLAAPMALNLDGLPGPDSIAVKIYAGNSRQTKPVPITGGTLEILAFEGLLKKSTNAPQPFKTWSFTAAQLRRHEYKASIGIGYEITASWSGEKARADKLTLIARYVAGASSRPIYSSPSTISLTAN